MRRLVITTVSLLLVACGGQQLPQKAATASQALTGTAELLEFEAPAVRADMFRELARQSVAQAGRPGSVFFPISRDGALVAAPGLDPRADLLGNADAGSVLQLVLDSPGDRWSEDRRETFQGLSEREAAELVARSLINLWGLNPVGPVIVERAAGAPWAAAWVDGTLRVNPAFVYMAAAPTAP